MKLKVFLITLVSSLGWSGFFSVSAQATPSCKTLGIVLEGELHVKDMVNGKIKDLFEIAPLESVWNVNSSLYSNLLIRVPRAQRTLLKGKKLTMRLSGKSYGPFAIEFEKRADPSTLRYRVKDSYIARLLKAPRKKKELLEISLQEKDEILCSQTMELHGGD